MQLECDYQVIQEQCREAIRMTSPHDAAPSSPPHPPMDSTPPTSELAMTLNSLYYVCRFHWVR